MYKESDVGIRASLTKTHGVGGRLKTEPEDFIVKEMSLRPEEKEDGIYTAAFISSRNWETNRLIKRLARNLRISRKRIRFAGTKDKRAVTTQLFVLSAPIDDVRTLRIPDVEVLETYRTDRRIMIGDLQGNEFEVTVREIKIAMDEVKMRTSAIKDELLDKGGFPNFFGVQRFGAVRPVTHIVGKYLVRGDFKKGVETYVANPVEGEPEEEFEVRKALQQSGDYEEALRTYPKNLSFEKAVLNHLVKKEDDYIGALNELPRNLLMMFVHSYQSYLFNEILSERMIRGLGLNEPLPGDLVLPVDKYGLPDHERWFKVGNENIDKLGKRCSEGKAFVSGILFGSETEFAGGEMGDIEMKVVKEEGLESKDFIVPRMPHVSSKGTRRELLAPLKQLDFEMLENGIKLSFQLTKGCYATSLLREFMKSDSLMAY